MITEQRYLIAQYAADPRRMETRNIGLILWANGKAEARFLQDQEAEDVVSDIATYHRWVDYWHKQTYAKVLEIPGQAPIPKSDPAFIDGLLKTQKGNYLLFDAGFVSQPVPAESVGDAAAFLFDQLVATRRSTIQTAEHDSITSIANNAFSAAGVADRENFFSNCKAQCKVFGVEQILTFNWGLGHETEENEKGNRNGHADQQHLDAVFQRVPLKQQFVFGTAAMFYSLQDAKKIRGKNRCASLVLVPEEEKDKPSVVKSLRTLSKVSEVIDLSDERNAVKQIKAMAG